MPRKPPPTTHPNITDDMTREQVLDRRDEVRRVQYALQLQLVGAGSSLRKRINRQRRPLLDELHAIGAWLRVRKAITGVVVVEKNATIAGADVATWEAAARADGGVA